MPVFKRKYRSGKITWWFSFDAPNSGREGRNRVTESGFATKAAALAAEAERRVLEQKRYELSKIVPVEVPLPKTLGQLLDEFFSEHAERKLAPKTIERYREQAAYLNPDLLKMALPDITPLHLSREWTRLLEMGGHSRRTKEPRPLSAKSVRNIAGVVSSAFGRAIRWGLVTANPVVQSEPPVPRRHTGSALTPGQQKLLFDAATGCWCLSAFLELSAATGARRGELLALRWSDLEDGAVLIGRSLSQTRAGLQFKPTKNGKIRSVVLPDSALAALGAHREDQDAFRSEFGAKYKDDLDLIFTNPNGTPLKPDSISASVSNLFRKLKLPKPKGASLHMLRHSHGSHLLASGMELPVVSERLGHSSVFVTATVYSHRVTGRDKEAAKKWDEFQKLHEVPKREQ
jgi:integrase